MKLSKCTIFVLLFGLFSISLNAQVTGAAKDAVKKAEDKVLTKAVEKTFNGLVNKLFGSDSTSVDEGSATVDSSGTESKSSFGGLFGSKPLNKKFDFDLTFEMEITSEDKKGKEHVIDTYTHYPESGTYIATETSSVLNIMDFGDMKNYSIVGGNVTILDLQRIIDKANKVAKKDKSNDDDEKEAPVFEKTGNKEVIAGFECEEYLMEDEEIKGNYWITQELNISTETVARSFSTNPDIDIPLHAQGMVLKMIIEDKKNKSKTIVITKSVTKEKKSYDLSKYKATDLTRLKF